MIHRLLTPGGADFMLQHRLDGLLSQLWFHPEDELNI
jgi:hypothetical protein